MYLLVAGPKPLTIKHPGRPVTNVTNLVPGQIQLLIILCLSISLFKHYNIEIYLLIFFSFYPVFFLNVHMFNYFNAKALFASLDVFNKLVFPCNQIIFSGEFSFELTVVDGSNNTDTDSVRLVHSDSLNINIRIVRFVRTDSLNRILYLGGIGNSPICSMINSHKLQNFQVCSQ